MSLTRRFLFSLTTLLVVLVVTEGAARVLWWALEQRAFETRKASGEAVLRNDGINFIKQADGTFGYVLIPGFSRGGVVINADGFAQRERVPLDKAADTLRLAALGESTTQGYEVDAENYPVHLRRRVEKQDTGYAHVEMINAGVAGWTSDQVALWTERKVAGYRPDVVILYVGWNDFQSYDPLRPAPTVPYFDQAYGGARMFVEASPLKLVSFASAAYGYLAHKLHWQRGDEATPAAAAATQDQTRYRASAQANYRFYVRSMDRIIAAFKARNPDVKIAVSTLIGRWPTGTDADYASDQGATWWMKEHQLSPIQAADALARFNNLIRDYVKTRGLVLVDSEAAFRDLDRARIQRDFAHMTPEGYELLAEVLYDGLRSAGALNGEPSPRLEPLRSKYRAAAPGARPNTER